MNVGVVNQRQGDQDVVMALTSDAGRLNGDLDEAVSIFVGQRPRLMAIAYRFLGSMSEVEDVVQETWLRWQKVDLRVVSNPQALLATMTVRLCINVSQSARRRRETPVGAWTPEAGDPSDDPATRAERREAVEQAVSIMMARLTPTERAAYVLREAFDYPYRQISEILQLGVDNTRQLVCRARGRIAADTGAVVGPAPNQRILQAFLTASRTGDLSDLKEQLAANLARG